MAVCLLASQCIIIVLFHHVLLVTAKCREAPKGTFETHPENQEVRKGENASFTCSIPHFDPNIHFVTWDIVRDVYDREVIVEFDENRNIFRSTVVVQSVGEETQFFRCELWKTLSGTQDKLCYFSNRARTIVRYFPSQREVFCSPKNSMPFEIGDTLSINCSTPRGKPAVDMGFILDGFTFQAELAEEGSRRSITRELSVTSDLHLITIMCEVSSRLSFPGRILQCPIGPIKVYQQIGVRVEPSQTTLLRGNDSITMSCLAEGYPDIFSFAWACFPPGYVEGCNARDKEATLSADCSLGEDPNDIEVVVSCSATNSRGTAASSSRVRILRTVWNECILLLKEKTSKSILKGNLTIEQINNTCTSYNKCTVNIECRFVSNMETPDIDVFCFFKNHFIKPYNAGKSVINSVYTYIYSLTIATNPFSDSMSLVTCEANTTNGHFRDEITITFNDSFMKMGQILTTESPKNSGTTISRITNYSNRFRHPIAAVIGCIVLACLLLVCIVAIVFTKTYKHLGGSQEKSDPAKTGRLQAQNTNIQKYDIEKLSVVSDSAYEIPNVGIPCFENDDQRDSLQERVHREIYSSLSDVQSNTSSYSSQC